MKLFLSQIGSQFIKKRGKYVSHVSSKRKTGRVWLPFLFPFYFHNHDLLLKWQPSNLFALLIHIAKIRNSFVISRGELIEFLTSRGKWEEKCFFASISVYPGPLFTTSFFPLIFYVKQQLPFNSTNEKCKWSTKKETKSQI